MKKTWLLSPFILSMLAMPVFGSEPGSGDVANCNFLEQNLKNDGSMKKGCKTCCSPEMNYRLSGNFTGYDLFAEALIWQVQEQGSFFVASPNEDSAIDPNYTYSNARGDFGSASFDWNGGFRIGFGYTFERDYWQALGRYTWFKTSGSQNFSGPASDTETQFLMPTFTDIQGSGLAGASNEAEFTYQVADLFMSRRFFMNNQIQLNFSLGASGGYIKEYFTTQYNNISNHTSVHNDWSFGGGGLSTALDANWHMGYGFGFFGRLYFAAMLGQYSNNSRITADSGGEVSDSVTDSPSVISRLEFDNLLMLPVTQFSLGFDWTRSFTNCWISAVKASVAGEFNNLSNLQQAFKVPNQNSETSSTSNNYKVLLRDIGSVYMYGVTVRLGGDF